MKIYFILVALTVLFVGTVFSQEEITPESSGEMQEMIDSLEKLLTIDVYDYPDVEAQFPGGAELMKKYLQENIVYPKEALENWESGRVYVTFIVEVDGSITNVGVMRGGVTKTLNDAAMELVRGMPNWIPAEVKGEPVRAHCRLPVTFTMQGGQHQEKGTE